MGLVIRTSARVHFVFLYLEAAMKTPPQLLYSLAGIRYSDWADLKLSVKKS